MGFPEKFPSLGFTAYFLHLELVRVVYIWYLLAIYFSDSFWNIEHIKYVRKTAIRGCVFSNGGIFLSVVLDFLMMMVSATVRLRNIAWLFKYVHSVGPFCAK